MYEEFCAQSPPNPLDFLEVTSRDVRGSVKVGYYPYREAIRWINDACGNCRVLFTGMWYRYPVAFYLRGSIEYEIRMEPRRVRYVGEQTGGLDETLARTLMGAQRDGFDLVLYHVPGDVVPDPPMNLGFVPTRVFENSAHRLVLYSRIGHKPF